jgi:DNA-binding NtrC family response regulator
MKQKKSILLYCTDRELLSTVAFALRLHPYDVTAVDDSRNAAAMMMAGSTELVCAVLIHARQGDFAGRLIHRLLEADLHIPLLLVDRAGDLAPVRYADMVLYGRNTTMKHILDALQTLCARGPEPGRAA